MEKVLLLERPTELTPEALQDALATRAKQVEVAEELSVEYAGFAAVLNYEDKAPGTPEGSWRVAASLHDELRQLEEEQRLLEEELAALEEENDALGERLGQLKAKDKRVQALDSNLVEEEAIVTAKSLALTKQLRSFEFKTMRNEELLRVLEKTCVENDAFHIWYKGPIATICGLKLGCLPGDPNINWVEVNAALGQLSMLLLLISSRVGCCFAKYQPIAMGSFSRMARTNDMKKSSELHYDRSFMPVRHLNQGMKAFYECVCELAAQVQTRNRSIAVLPYSMSKKEGGLGLSAVTYTKGKEMQWSMGMKFLATNLKWLLAYS